MVTALLVGLVVGFVLVMPPGPIAMACMRQALGGQTREGLEKRNVSTSLSPVHVSGHRRVTGGLINDTSHGTDP